MPLARSNRRSTDRGEVRGPSEHDAPCAPLRRLMNTATSRAIEPRAPRSRTRTVLRWGSTYRRWVHCALLVVGLVRAMPAHAHGILKTSEPTAGAHIAIAPTSIQLVFTEQPSLALTSIRLTGPGGESVALRSLSAGADARFAVMAQIEGRLASGVYTVQWQVAGNDGHPTSGSYRFTLALPMTDHGADATASDMHQDPISQPVTPVFGVESPAYVAIRWVQYGALLVVIGVVAFALLVLPRLHQVTAAVAVAAMRSQAARVGVIATLFLGGTAILRLLAQSYALHGALLTPDPALLGTLLRVTQWGRAWLLEAVAILIALVAFALARRHRRGMWPILGIAATAMAGSMALSGHAAAAPRLLTLAIAADALHIIGAGGWLGSLVVLAVVGIPASLRAEVSERWHAVSLLVNAFSSTALACAALTAVTGVFAAWLHVASLTALWQTQYGQTLLLKLAALSLAAGVGFYNWRRVTPLLGTVPAATRRLQRSTAAELSIGVIVILLTAVLVATPTGMDM